MKIKVMREEKKEEELRKEKWVTGVILGLFMKLMSPYEKEKVARVPKA